MKSKEELIKREVSDEERKELILSLREKKKDEIIKEIKKEYKEELLREIHVEKQKERDRQKLEDFQGLMWNGFFLAFFVGLAVNQVTDIIGYYKGTVTVKQIWLTTMIAAVLCTACLIAYLYTFCRKAITMYNDWKKDHEEK